MKLTAVLETVLIRDIAVALRISTTSHSEDKGGSGEETKELHEKSM